MSTDGDDQFQGLESLAIAGYRSFGAELQYFPRLAKINILIGQNNSGKSNVLRFIKEQIGSGNRPGRLQPEDRFLGQATHFFGIGLGPIGERLKELADQFKLEPHTLSYQALKKLLEAAVAGQDDWFIFDSTPTLRPTTWEQAFKKLTDHELASLWQQLTHQQGGDRYQHWIPETLRTIVRPMPAPRVELISAFRKIAAGSEGNEFSGAGLIAQLAQLQRPSISRLEDKAKFRSVRDFVRSVLSNPGAEIDIPQDLATIHVELDGKTLSIESLGTGIHEVIILAAAATTLEHCVVCIEEPELHLNPLLQKKLMRYLVGRTSNQYLIASHSAALMDTPNAEVYHLAIHEGSTRVERVTSDGHRFDICVDLGYRPSDLLQTNCIVWVEGPSDRIYMEWWISTMDDSLVEGIHYSIMFYGGRLASHLSADDEAADEFIKLRRLNRRGVIVMDSDKDGLHARINATKKRLRVEFENDGVAFVTAGREIENYLSPAALREILATVHPGLPLASALGQFDNALTLTAKNGERRQADKVRVAHAARTLCGSPDFARFGLGPDIKRVVNYIRDSNPAIEI